MTLIAKRKKQSNRSGIVLIMSMIFVLIFSTLAVSFFTISGANVQLASNQHKANSALSGAQSGLECGRFILSNFHPSVISDGSQITQAQADTAWNELCSHIQSQQLDGQVVSNAVTFTNAIGTGDEITTPSINYDSTNVSFQLRFYRYNSDPLTIIMESIGSDGVVSRKAAIDIIVKKDTSILQYAVASKSRVIITGDSTIDGDIYSTWDKPNVAPPFEMENTATVLGTINTVINKSYFDITDANYVGYALEGDKVAGTYQGINYNQPNPTTPGFDYTDYDTSSYAAMTTTLPASGTTVKEYFPHDPNDYTKPADGSSSQLNRQVYDGLTFTDKRLPAGRNSLFRNCTFEGIFFIGIGGNGSNNIRFDNCQFNGILVTDVPNNFKWKKNMLYFTGSALFNNSYMQEATILAPNFNVNLGNTQKLVSQSQSVLTGLIVGGIVDVRGNANIDGTILSMYDPGPLGNVAALYATNVGFSDENNEAGIPADKGTIYIHPDPGRLLPIGIKSDIKLEPIQESYTEN